MPRPCKPANLKTGKDLNKEELEQRQQAEENITANIGDDLLQEVPSTLGEIGRAYYLFILEQLKTAGVLSNIDRPILTETAQILEYAEKAKLDIEKYGQMYETADGRGMMKLVKNPAVDIYNTMMNQFKTFGTQLGLSPSSRATLGALNVQQAVNEINPLLQALSDDDEDEE